MSNELNVHIFATGTLPPGGSVQWFMDNVSQYRVRTFTVVPTGGKHYVNRDQTVEVSQVFHIQKGTNHAVDGPKVPGQIQVNIVVTNLDQKNECFYLLLWAETDNDFGTNT